MHDLLSIFKALSDKNRLRIVSALLSHDELCACQIIELLNITGATASRHLGILINSGLIESRKDGRWVHYKLVKTQISPIVKWLDSELKTSSQIVNDIEALTKILACDPASICKKNRQGT